MLRIKRLYLYILQEFLPMFFMTFAICLFILLMQFLWKYVEDLVGKGLETLVLAELFFYATLSIIPMALPLAILLASLMSFGNLGERFELTAIKAAGISLFRAMHPLIIIIMFVCIGAFFFQNEAMPKINVKITSLLRSIKIKSPELDIPEGTFYNEIFNYNLFVREKDKKTGTLRDVMIYDSSDGFDKTRIIVCDSAKMKMSAGKDYLLLTLYHGQQFANFNQAGEQRNARGSKFVPYSRENFSEKEIIIPFDASFNRLDENSLQSSQIAKNIRELEYSIDSLTILRDSMNVIDRRVVAGQTYRYFDILQDSLRAENLADSNIKLDFDSLLNSLSTEEKVAVYSSAIHTTESNKNDILYRSMSKVNTDSDIRYHKVEWHRKFTLSFACLIFFFIGAPLGAIIRKGGLGMPVVVSVILFIFYYIIDNVGRKMARDGVWDAWQGIWLSSFILFPLGVFLTYKAMNDSALFNVDAYRNYYFRIFGDPKTKTLPQLAALHAQNGKRTLIAYLSAAVLLIGSIFAGGVAGDIIRIVGWVALATYILLFMKQYIDADAFFNKTERKKNFKQKILFFAVGIPFPFITNYKTQKQMNRLLEGEAIPEGQ